MQKAIKNSKHNCMIIFIRNIILKQIGACTKHEFKTHQNAKLIWRKTCRWKLVRQKFYFTFSSENNNVLWTDISTWFESFSSIGKWYAVQNILAGSLRSCVCWYRVSFMVHYSQFQQIPYSGTNNLFEFVRFFRMKCLADWYKTMRNLKCSILCTTETFIHLFAPMRNV